MNEHLFSSIKLGRLKLKHRIVMAPLTRSRAGQPGNVPTTLNAEYYRQRASAALIITEATQISPQGQGYAWTPGIHSEQQVAGWAEVSKAVHEEGGHIFLQLWHVGRVSHQMFQPNGALPVAPSAQAAPGKTFITDSQGNGIWGEMPVPQALTPEGISSIVGDYRVAARNAILAGMDGVEIHAGNGYLIDQFINSNSNLRNDIYGGDIPNRALFLLEVVEAVAGEIGADRVAVRMTPMGHVKGMGDNTPRETFAYIARELNHWGLAYLHLVEPIMRGTRQADCGDQSPNGIIGIMRREFEGPLILAGGYGMDSAEEALNVGRADLIAFGRPFIANPDLPARFREGRPIAIGDSSTYFGGGPQGYTDYPSLA